MDSSIDRVNQALTGKTTRRQAFRLLGGGMVAGVAGGAALSAVLKDAAAQSNQDVNVGQLVSGLINVNVGAVAINIGDITLEDLVDVNDVLNDNEIRILNNILNNNEVASRNQDFLNNLLRGADILDEVQVVVGVLSGPIFVIQ